MHHITLYNPISGASALLPLKPGPDRQPKASLKDYLKATKQLGFPLLSSGPFEVRTKGPYRAPCNLPGTDPQQIADHHGLLALQRSGFALPVRLPDPGPDPMALWPALHDAEARHAIALAQAQDAAHQARLEALQAQQSLVAYRRQYEQALHSVKTERRLELGVTRALLDVRLNQLLQESLEPAAVAVIQALQDDLDQILGAPRS